MSKSNSSLLEQFVETLADTAGQFIFLTKNRNFARLWIGATLSSICDQMFIIALPVWLYALTGSVRLVAGGAAIQTAAILAFSLIAGVLLDRWNRKYLLTAATLGMAGLLLLLTNRSISAQLWPIYVILFCISALNRINSTGMVTLLKSVVLDEDLTRANGLVVIGWSMAVIFGPLLAAVLLMHGNATAVFQLDAISFVLYAAMVLSLHMPVTTRTVHKPTVVRSILDGARLVFANAPLRGILAFNVVLMLGVGGITSLLYVFLLRVGGIGANGFAYRQTAEGIGALIGGMLVFRVGKRYSEHVAVGTSIVIAGCCVFVYALFPKLPLVLMLAFIEGIASQIGLTIAYATFQRICPSEFIGRATAVRQTMTSLATTVSIAVATIFVGFLTLQAVFLILTGLVIAAGVMSYFVLAESDHRRE